MLLVLDKRGHQPAFASHGGGFRVSAKIQQHTAKSNRLNSASAPADGLAAVTDGLNGVTGVANIGDGVNFFLRSECGWRKPVFHRQMKSPTWLLVALTQLFCLNVCAEETG